MIMSATHSQSVWRRIGWSGLALLFLVPVVAMQITDDVAWSPGDFALFALLLAGGGLGCEFLLGKSTKPTYRAAAALAVFTTLLLLWANAALGLIGSEANDANLLYFSVPATAALGAFVARFRARGMTNALFATAAAQLLVPVIAQVIGLSSVPVGTADTVLVTGAFVALWVSSAWLFHRAAAMPAEPVRRPR